MLRHIHALMSTAVYLSSSYFVGVINNRCHNLCVFFAINIHWEAPFCVYLLWMVQNFVLGDNFTTLIAMLSNISNSTNELLLSSKTSQIAKFMGPTWGPPGSCRPQMGPMLAPWTLLSGFLQPKLIWQAPHITLLSRCLPNVKASS